MEGLKITGTSLTTEAAEHIMTTAVEAGNHGISYWATVEKTNRRIGGNQMITRLWIKDVEADKPKKFSVSVAKVALAVSRMLCDPERTDSAGWTRRLMDDDLDGPLADAIVQVACHGKVIYG